jgi:hypothetical protein
MSYQTGKTYAVGDFFIRNDEIWECLVAGVQTGTFEDNSDKWKMLTSENTDQMVNAGTGTIEDVEEETVYVSPEQHGSLWGTVYRQYFPAQENSDTITITGVGEVLDYMVVGNHTVYRGYSADGTNEMSIAVSTDTLTFTITNWECEGGYVDYILSDIS